VFFNLGTKKIRVYLVNELQRNQLNTVPCKAFSNIVSALTQLQFLQLSNLTFQMFPYILTNTELTISYQEFCHDLKNVPQ